MPKKKKFTGYASARRPGRRIRGVAISGHSNLNHLKPKKFSDYLTLGEVSSLIGVDARWLKRLEAADRIPRAQRVPMGKLEMRLWSPAQVEEIKQVISENRPGPRPS